MRGLGVGLLSLPGLLLGCSLPPLCPPAPPHTPSHPSPLISLTSPSPLPLPPGVRALPAFCAFRGSDGHLESFTAGPSKAGVLAAAVERHNSPRCQLGGPAGSPALTALAAQRRAGAEAALAAASGAGVA